tara:strand:- start:1404 stop:2120 length:717 start_codon:yes stop_codon:yes gene_type:complete
MTDTPQLSGATRHTISAFINYLDWRQNYSSVERLAGEEGREQRRKAREKIGLYRDKFEKNLIRAITTGFLEKPAAAESSADSFRLIAQTAKKALDQMPDAAWADSVHGESSAFDNKLNFADQTGSPYPIPGLDYPDNVDPRAVGTSKDPARGFVVKGKSFDEMFEGWGIWSDGSDGFNVSFKNKNCGFIQKRYTTGSYPEFLAFGAVGGQLMTSKIGQYETLAGAFGRIVGFHAGHSS